MRRLDAIRLVARAGWRRRAVAALALEAALGLVVAASALVFALQIRALRARALADDRTWMVTRWVLGDGDAGVETAAELDSLRALAGVAAASQLRQDLLEPQRATESVRLAGSAPVEAWVAEGAGDVIDVHGGSLVYGRRPNPGSVPPEVVVNEELAAALAARPPDLLGTDLVSSTRGSARVVGIARGMSAAPGLYPKARATLARIANPVAGVQARFAVRAKPGVDCGPALRAWAAAAHPGRFVEVRSSRDARSSMAQPLGVMQVLLTVLAAVVLGLGALGVFATTAWSAAALWREMALHRAFGASQAQVRWALLLEVALWLALGLALGVWPAAAIHRLLAPDLEARVAPPVVALAVAVLAFAVGLAAACLALPRRAIAAPAEATRAP